MIFYSFFLPSALVILPSALVKQPEFILFMNIVYQVPINEHIAVANILADLVCCLLKAGIISLLDEEEPQLKVGNCLCVGN